MADNSRAIAQFWNDPSTNSDLDVHITVSGEVLDGHDGFSDDFVHNFYGYLSCESVTTTVYQV